MSISIDDGRSRPPEPELESYTHDELKIFRQNRFGMLGNYYLKEEAFKNTKAGCRLSIVGAYWTVATDPKRLNTLLLALSVVVLWVYELGEQVLRKERRSEIDPAYQRQLSVFHLGWRLLRRLISCAEPPAVRSVSSRFD